MRDYMIEDDGEEVQLALFVDGVQVGGAMFPDDGSGAARARAEALGAAWWGSVQVAPGGSAATRS